MQGVPEKGFAVVNSDGSGLPDDIGTDEIGQVQSVSPNRWGRTGEETPGGMAILEDGSINTARFSEGPDTELEVTWWNKRLLWKVRREPTGHRVVVARVTENIWRTHIMIGAAIIVVAVAGLVLFGGLPVLYGIVLGVVLALVGYGALVWEQRAGDESAGIEEIIEMDSLMWNGVRKKASSEYLAYTKEGQKRRYDEAVAHARTLYERKYGAEGTGKVGKTYAAGGKVLPVPKFKVPQKITDEFLNEASRLSPDEVADKIKALMLPARQEVYRRQLLSRYRENPKRVEAMGRGVLRCECAACEVQAELGIVAQLSGAEAARNRAAAAQRQVQAGPVDPATSFEQLRQAAGRLRGKSESVDEDGSSKETRKAREALAKAEASARERSQAQAEEDEKQAQREQREASRARIANDDDARVSSSQNESERAATAPKKKRNKSQAAIIGVAAVVAIIVVGLVGAIVVSAQSKEPEAPTLTLPESAASTATTSTSPTLPTTSAPPARPANGEVVGVPIPFGPDDPGNQNGGAAVIAAYDYAYYVKRSGPEAMALYAPGAQPPVDEAQNAIDANPIGTKHSLVITPVVVGQEYDVLLKITWPGTPEQEFPQKFFVTYSNGKYFLLRKA